MIDKDKLINDLNIYGSSIVSEMIIILNASDKKASGRLLASLSIEFRQTIEGIKLLINGEDYAQYVDEGRKPGSYPPISKIREWVKIKGLPEKSVLPIARKIYKFGIKPRPFLSESIIKNESLFEKQLKKNIISSIDNILLKQDKNK